MDRLSVGPLPRPDEVAVDLSDIDPTLDSCCRRDAEDSRMAQSKRSLLQRHDRVAAYERTRTQQHAVPQGNNNNPHLVTVNMMGGINPETSFFEGCRCSYDPSKDGGHDYPALAELRARSMPDTQEQEEDKHEESDSDDDELDAFMEGFGDSSRNRRNNDGTNDDNDDDDDPLLLLSDAEATEWEKQRRLQLIQQIQCMEVAQQHGYGGVHRELHPGRVLRVAGLVPSSSSQPPNASSRQRQRIPPACCVIHLYDPESMASASLDLLFETSLAPQYPGTMFVRSDGRNTLRLERTLLLDQTTSSPHSRWNRTLTTLVDGPRDSSLPALLVVLNGRIVNACCGFHNTVDVNWIDPTTGRVIFGAVQEWLERSSDGNDGGSPVLRRDPPPTNELCHLRPEELALLDYLRQGSANPTNGIHESSLLSALECRGGETGDDPDYYDCGMPGCRKTYQHQHVGGGGRGTSGRDDENSRSDTQLPFTLADE